MNRWGVRLISLLVSSQMTLGNAAFAQGHSRSLKSIDSRLREPGRWRFAYSEHRGLSFVERSHSSERIKIPLRKGEKIKNVTVISEGAWIHFESTSTFLSNDELETIVEMDRLQRALNEKRNQKIEKTFKSLHRTANVLLGVLLAALLIKLANERVKEVKTSRESGKTATEALGEVADAGSDTEDRESALSYIGHTSRMVALGPIVAFSDFITYVGDKYIPGTAGRHRGFGKFLGDTLHFSIAKESGVPSPASVVRQGLIEIPARVLLRMFFLFVAFPGVASALVENIPLLALPLSSLANNSPESFEIRWFLAVTTLINLLNSGPGSVIRGERHRNSQAAIREAHREISRSYPNIDANSPEYRRLVKLATTRIIDSKITNMPKRSGFLFDGRSVATAGFRALGYRGDSEFDPLSPNYLLEDSPGALFPILKLTERELKKWLELFPNDASMIQEALDQVQEMRNQIDPVISMIRLRNLPKVVAKAISATAALTSLTHYENLIVSGEVPALFASAGDKSAGVNVVFREAFRRAASAIREGDSKAQYLGLEKSRGCENLQCFFEIRSFSAPHSKERSPVEAEKRHRERRFQTRQRLSILTRATQNLDASGSGWLERPLLGKTERIAYCNAFIRELFGQRLAKNYAVSAGEMDSSERELADQLRPGGSKEEMYFEIAALRDQKRFAEANELELIELAGIVMDKLYASRLQSGKASPFYALDTPRLGASSWARHNLPFVDLAQDTFLRSWERIPTTTLLYVTAGLFYGATLSPDSYLRLLALWPVGELFAIFTSRWLATKNIFQDRRDSTGTTLHALLIELSESPANFLKALLAAGGSSTCDSALSKK